MSLENVTQTDLAVRHCRTQAIRIGDMVLAARNRVLISVRDF
jgi:hypothetical protein